MSSWKYQIALLTAGGTLSLLGLIILSRSDAACIVEALHPQAQSLVDPAFRQQMEYFPLQWTCTWPDIQNGAITTYFDPLAACLSYSGLAVVLIALLLVAGSLVVRGRPVR